MQLTSDYICRILETGTNQSERLALWNGMLSRRNPKRNMYGQQLWLEAYEHDLNEIEEIYTITKTGQRTILRPMTVSRIAKSFDYQRDSG